MKPNIKFYVYAQIVGRGKQIEDIFRRERPILGNATPPIQAWLLQRGLRTLPIRMRAHEKSALTVANYLEGPRSK